MQCIPLRICCPMKCTTPCTTLHRLLVCGVRALHLACLYDVCMCVSHTIITLSLSLSLLSYSPCFVPSPPSSLLAIPTLKSLPLATPGSPWDRDQTSVEGEGEGEGEEQKAAVGGAVCPERTPSILSQLPKTLCPLHWLVATLCMYVFKYNCGI